METLVFDIETDNTDIEKITRIHCIVIYDGTDVSFYHEKTLGQAIERLSKAEDIIGHNIVQYDLPVLERFSGWTPSDNQNIYDTMLIGYIGWPENQQSLEDWGIFVGSEASKIKITDFSVYSPDLGTRCVEDTKLNWDVWKYQEQRFTDWESLSLETEVMKIHVEQVKHGVYIDFEHVEKTVKAFDQELQSLETQIVAYAPKKVHGGKYKPISDPYLKGSTKHKKAVVDWFPESNLRATVKGGFSRLIIDDFNPSSDPQVKELLLSLGWRPTEYNWKIMPDGTKVRMSPKLTEDSFGSLPPGLGQQIAEFKSLSHRRNFLANKKDPQARGLLSNIDFKTSRVKAEAITCGTPTSRYTHKGSVCNVPDNGAYRGEEMRRSFAVPFDRWMLGLDLDGIEARMLAHYCSKYTGGQELIDATVGGGDFHSMNASAWGIDRKTAKGVLYA